MPRAKKAETPEKTWEKLKMEYITDDQCSYRSLERKYGIPFSRIRTRAQKEKWQQEKAEYKSKVAQKSLDLISDQTADDCARAFRIASDLLGKIEEGVKALDPADTKALKLLTSSIRDLKEIGVFRSEMDRLEQEARIKKLQKEAEEEQTDTTITVVFEENEYGV